LPPASSGADVDLNTAATLRASFVAIQWLLRVANTILQERHFSSSDRPLQLICRPWLDRRALSVVTRSASHDMLLVVYTYTCIISGRRYLSCVVRNISSQLLAYHTRSMCANKHLVRAILPALLAYSATAQLELHISYINMGLIRIWLNAESLECKLISPFANSYGAGSISE
jgi:hypothetical protein